MKLSGTKSFPNLVVVGCLILAGCNGNAQKKASQRQTSNLRNVISLYNFASSSLGRIPATREEFLQFAEVNCGHILERFQVAQAEELLVSERDGEPFVLIYGKHPQNISSEIVAYEQTGVDGKREVGFALGYIKELDETEFHKLVPIGAISP